MAVVVGAVIVAALAATMILLPRSATPQQHGIQTVNVAMGPDGSVTSVTTASVTRDAEGRVTEAAQTLDPTRAVADLPVRVQTSWWHDGRSGTDLAALSGESGRFTIQVTVEDLTAQATELSYETDGVRYRQQALVGVPLTVVASARVGAGDRVVQGVEDGALDARTTNGVLVETSDTGRSVQWAAFLAPPVLSDTAELTLVLDSDDFEVPAIDLTVQPGLLTDPSVEALVQRAFGADGDAARLQGSTVALVLDVTAQITSAREFVDDVHAALQEDVAQIGEQTYRELETSAGSVLDHLRSTADDLGTILGTTQGDTDRLGTQTHAQVRALAQSLDGLLGSTRTPPEIVGSTVTGCSVQMPALADGQTRTVASTVHLADAQLRTIVGLFESGQDAMTSTCRDALHQIVAETIGDPGALADPAQATVCRQGAEETRPVACTLLLADESLQAGFAIVAQASSQAQDAYDGLDVAALAATLDGPDGLATALGDLRTAVADLRTGAGSLADGLDERLDTVEAAVARATTGVGALRSAAAAISTSASGLRSTVVDVGQDLDTAGTADDALASVGEWFIGSGVVEAIDALAVTDDDCQEGWDVGLGRDPSVSRIASALTRLESAACPAAQVAAATRELVTGYAQTSTAVGQMGTALGTASSDLAGARRTIDDLVALTGPSGALVTGIDALWEPATGTGALADVAHAVAELRSASGGGDLTVLEQSIDALATGLDAIWPDDSVQPVDAARSCPEILPGAGERPDPAGQGVVWLTNRLVCAESGLGGRLDSLDGQILAGATGAEDWMAQAAGSTQVAADRSDQQIDQLSDQVVQEVTAQREAALAGSLDLVEGARSQVRTDLEAILAGYDLAMGEMLTRLDTSMTRSATRSTEVAQVLDADFADLVANLGSPDPAARTGLLGKLHGITTQVGETGTVLDATGSTTSAYGNLRSADLRELDLRSAQLGAADERLAGFRPFAQAGEDVRTVLVVQIRGEQGA